MTTATDMTKNLGYNSKRKRNIFLLCFLAYSAQLCRQLGYIDVF